MLEILLEIYESTKDIKKQKVVIEKLLKINPRNSVAKTKMAKLLLTSDGESEIMEAEELLRGIEGP